MPLVDDIALSPPPTLRTRGRRKVETNATKERDLTAADLVLLDSSAPRPTAQPPSLKRIKDSHHALARALASGMKHTEASIVTGYDPSRISILCSDPTFKALVDFYRSNLNAVFADLHSRMATLSLDAASRLRDLLEDDENKLSAGVLLDILEKTADRTGYNPKHQVEVKTLHLTPEDLRRLSHETNEEGRVLVQGSQADRGLAISGPGGGEPVAEAEAEGLASEGKDV